MSSNGPPQTPASSIPSRDECEPVKYLDRINILIVDDEPKNLTVLETVLDDPGYRIVRASSADQALLALIADEFALLILDIRMPDMTGLELAHMIKERMKTARVPIIFLTAYYNEDQHVLEAYSTGAVDFLHKPVNPAVLRSKVAVFAELHRRNLENTQINKELLAEVAERRRVEEQLQFLNNTLEKRVRERTEELWEKELRLRQAADAARLTYVELDFQQGEIRTAENFASVMGYAPPENGRGNIAAGIACFVQHVDPRDRKPVEAALKMFREGKPGPKLDYRIVGDDHRERWIESAWVVERNPLGKARRSFLTNLDVTDRKRAQDQLRESEERFRQLADSMPQMVWTARADGEVDYYNARWHEFTGFGPEKYGDLKNWEPILHPEDFVRTVESWKECLRNGDPHRVEYRFWDRRTNRYSWHLGRALPFRDDGGTIMKWIGTCTEIDEQKRTEEDLRRANQALEHFAFAASHDLQEPLRNVAVYTQLLRKRYGSSIGGQANDFMQVIIDGAQRMSRLVSDLLAYTSVAGLDREPIGTVDTEKLFEQVSADLHQVIRERRAEVTHDPLPRVYVKDVHLRQLFQNLIGNALKYQEDETPPKVHVTALKVDGQWQFSVIDNGIGISPEYQEQVFGVFRRLHVNEGKYAGTGIGLAICQRIVERYGGRIWVESKLGAGATFYFTLPAEGGS